MITDLDVIVKEWAYRVNDGKPNPNNSTHLYHLSEILIEYKWPYQVIDEIIQNLVEQETKFKGRTKDGKLRYFKTKDSLDKALEKGTVEPIKEPDKKDDEPQQDPTKLSGPKDFERPSDDTPKQEPKKKSIKAPTEKERKKQRQEEATKNADTREKPDLKFKSKEKNILKDAGVDPQKAANELANGSLDSLRKLTEHTQKLRAQGKAGAGGPVASEGESKFTQANNEMKKGPDGKSENDKFKEKNKKKIQEKSQEFKDGKVNGKKRPNKEDEDTLKQLGFEKPYPDEAYEYLATRKVWGESKLAEVKEDKKSVYYTKFKGPQPPRPTEPGKAQDKWDEKEGEAKKKYMSWMNAAYDGAISTQAHLEGSRLDTSKDHEVSQATPEQDKIVETALQSNYDKFKEICAKNKTEKEPDPTGACKKADHYARELKKWDEFKEFHDTYAIGQDKDGNMVYIPISNKKGSHMKDPQNNTTPAQRMAFIKRQFGENISKNVGKAIDDGINEVSKAKATTIEDTANLSITDEIVKEFESERFTKYRLDLDDQATGVDANGNKKPLGKWLESQKPPVEWDKLTSRQKLELTQKFAKEILFDEDGNPRIRYNSEGKMLYKDPETGEEKEIRGLGSIGLRYETFGKLGIKFGEFGASEEAVALKDKESAVVKKVHKDVTTALFKEDEPDGYDPEERPDADNGNNVQAYITGVLKAVHADTYIDMEDDEDYDVLVQMGVNGVRPSHIRECLAELSGFDGDINEPGGREALKEHLRKRCRIKPGEDKVSVEDSDGNNTELFNDQWRTAGAGTQKVATHFGQGMIDCMTKKVQKK